MQNATYLCKIIQEVVVDKVGPAYVVQLVTDNGANFKKACSMVVVGTYTSCLAAFINGA
jgi:hypothetical protein